MKQETTGKQFAESADKVITVTRKQLGQNPQLN